MPRDRQHAAHSANRAVESELAEKGESVHRLRGHDAECDEQSDGDGQVESGSGLSSYRRATD